MTDARALAYQILLQMDRNGSYPDRLVGSMLDRHPLPHERDRALVTELVYGVLRWRARLDWHIDGLSRVKPRKIAPPVRLLLRLALYQMLFLDRVPDHAAIHEAVKTARSTQPPHIAKFVNAILREAQRRHPRWDLPSRLEDPAGYLVHVASYPPWLVNRFLAEWGVESTAAFCEASNETAPLALRVNPLKTTTSEVLRLLGESGIDGEPSSCLENAVRLHRPGRDVSRIPLYEQGAVQVQDEASQLVSRLVDPRPGERVADLCAGFGGKSTHLGILMKNRGDLLAVDEASWKLEHLADNARRQGLSIVRTLGADVLELSSASAGLFDRVLLDAPCSGFGVLRRNPDIKWRRGPKDPYRFGRLQSSLLERGSALVKPGGVLVYATCTVFPEENEAVARRFSEARPDWVIEDASEFLPSGARHMADPPFFQSRPHLHGVDGFFAARWRRPLQREDR